MLNSKIGIIGLGKVGKAVLTNVLRSNLFSDIVLIDKRKDHIKGEVMDQQHGAGSYKSNNFNIKEGSYDDLSDSKIIVIAANHYYDDETRAKIISRQDLLKDNIQELNDIMSNITKVTQEAILIFISNPVDTWTHLAVSRFNYPKEKCIGTGTLLDTSRLKYFIGKKLNINPQSVSGFMVGEHGHTSLIASKYIGIEGIPLKEFESHYPNSNNTDFEILNSQIIEAPLKISNIKKGGTDAAIGYVTSDLISSIMLNEHILLPVSSWHNAGTMDNENDSSFSLPTQIGSQGIERTFEVKLTDQEQIKFKESINTINKSINLGHTIIDNL